jgi:hypothetical protein
MTKEQLLPIVAAVLETALEVEQEGTPFPLSTVYLLLGMDMAKWETVRNVLLHAGLVTVTTDTLHLTEKGRGYASRLAGHGQPA